MSFRQMIYCRGSFYIGLFAAPGNCSVKKSEAPTSEFTYNFNGHTATTPEEPAVAICLPSGDQRTW